MTFSQVIGQDDAEQQLMELIHEDRVPHAMLLCGPEGCGQLAVALAFACELLRLGHTGEHAQPRLCWPSWNIPTCTLPTLQ